METKTKIYWKCNKTLFYGGDQTPTFISGQEYEQIGNTGNGIVLRSEFKNSHIVDRESINGSWLNHFTLVSPLPVREDERGQEGRVTGTETLFVCADSILRQVKHNIEAGKDDAWTVEEISHLVERVSAQENKELLEKLLEASANYNWQAKVNRKQKEQLDELNKENGELREALSNLIFTAQKLWDDAKPIKDTPAMTATHPIIEEAKAALSTNKDNTKTK